MSETQTVTLSLTVTLNKPIKDMTDIFAGRIYTIDGVTDCSVSTNLPAPAQGKEAFDFEAAIKKFNEFYNLPANDVPTILFSTPEEFIGRLKNFKDILQEELNEVDDIIKAAEPGTVPIKILVMLADWLGDMQVYCASEMAKFGLPRNLILSIIMASNMSKGDENGKPIYDERGKVKKGPYYWKPEPQIERALQAIIRQAQRGNVV